MIVLCRFIMFKSFSVVPATKTALGGEGGGGGVGRLVGGLYSNPSLRWSACTVVHVCRHAAVYVHGHVFKCTIT